MPLKEQCTGIEPARPHPPPTPPFQGGEFSAIRSRMLTQTHAKARGLVDLEPVAEDSLIGLIALVNADRRPDKIDVGVGVFRDGDGNTPILEVMKEAERRLTATQVTKA